MQSINALSLAPDARKWLANSCHPRILHVFDHACNLLSERREVLSIVTPQIGNGPFNLVISRLRKSPKRLPDLGASWQTSEVFSTINVESPVSIFGDQLTLGDLIINTVNAKIWSPRPDWEKLHAKKTDILIQLAKLPITNYQETGGFDTPLGEHSELLNHRSLPITQSLISNLSSSVATADIISTQKITSKLAGLGIGLTPSGDDFLLGAIYAAWIIHPPEVARVLAEEISNTAAPLTTSLSAAWLRAGGRGEAGVLWHGFFNALLIADSDSTQLHVAKLLSMGHTSGADALAGFTGSFSHWSNVKGEQNVNLSAVATGM